MLQSLAAIFLRLGSKLAVASPETQKPIAMDGLRGTLVPIPGIGPGTSPLPRECSATEPNGQYELLAQPLCFLTSTQFVERETGIEPASLAWKARVLPLNYSRIDRKSSVKRKTLKSCLYKPCHISLKNWWRRLDSNQRRRKPTDLQSAPFSHSGTPPQNLEF